jgi:hypothetical protein
MDHDTLSTLELVNELLRLQRTYGLGYGCTCYVPWALFRDLLEDARSCMHNEPGLASLRLHVGYWSVAVVPLDHLDFVRYDLCV